MPNKNDYKRELAAGAVLIAEPFMDDDNFSRSVVLICAHDADGAIGLTLNKSLELPASEFITKIINPDVMMNEGGPVDKSYAQFLHRCGDVIDESNHLGNGIYWGGNINQAIEMLNIGLIAPTDIRFFIGYAGWGPNQLEDEIDENAWIVARTTADIIFDNIDNNLWKVVLSHLGPKFKLLSNYPTDPRLN